MKLFILLIYLCIECYLIILSVSEFGFFAIILEVIISFLFGVGILASQGSMMFESLRNITEGRANIASFVGRSFFRLFGGVLLIIPGVLSDIFGITFFIISLLFKSDTSNTSRTQQHQQYQNNDDIIDVEVTSEDTKSHL